MHWATSRPELAAEYAKKADELKDRVGEFEKFRIAVWYHCLVTGDLYKRMETSLLQRQTYPREYTGLHDLAVVYYLLGQSDQVIVEARESIMTRRECSGRLIGPEGNRAST